MYSHGGGASRRNLGDLHCKLGGGSSCLPSRPRTGGETEPERDGAGVGGGLGGVRRRRSSQTCIIHVRAHASAGVCARPDSADSGRCVRCAATKSEGMLGQRYSPPTDLRGRPERPAHSFVFLFVFFLLAALLKRLTAAKKKTPKKKTQSSAHWRGNSSHRRASAPPLTQPR